MVTIKEILKKYKVTKPTVYSWIKDGMPSYKIGKLLRFDESEVDTWIKQKKITRGE